jgi:hypothetical protein
MRFVGFAGFMIRVAVGLSWGLGCGQRSSPPVERAPVPAQSEAGAAGAVVGSTAPAAQLTALSGDKLALADVLHQHARTVLVFYRGFW